MLDEVLIWNTTSITHVWSIVVNMLDSDIVVSEFKLKTYIYGLIWFGLVWFGLMVYQPLLVI